MKQDALKLLEEIVTNGKGRQRRFTELIRSPTEADSDWFMCVPTCFNGALDIQQTIRIVDSRETLTWTQGTNFSFAAGDRIYDTSKAYDQWSEALKHIHYCIHVTHATAVRPSETSVPRKTGSVTFELLVPNPSHSGLTFAATHTSTQDELVRFIIAGVCPQLELTPGKRPHEIHP